MRVLLTVQFDTEKANKAIRDQSLATTVKSVLERLKPEAAFFGSQNGERTGFFVFDLQEPSQIPPIAEPFFQELGAKVTFTPVMSFDDVQAGLQAYGSG
jgi:hypothetical protein